jgi:NAD(P)-dependent dehydrogenase (short-subunit alcohol dehydrogenase family)
MTAFTKSFEDQVVLVTGGSTGIGAAVARQLAQAGARVVITGRHEAALKASAARHPAIAYLVADIAQPADVARSLDEVKTRFGRLDVLINNAGILEMVALADASSAHVRRTFQTNVEGLIETTRAALPLLRKAKGAIINVATIVADQPFANMSVYCASKAAVLALTRSWAQELAPEGIRVNAVSPGTVATDFVDRLLQTFDDPKAERAAMDARQAIGRMVTPREVADAIAFLASPRSSATTGTALEVDGGVTHLRVRN